MNGSIADAFPDDIKEEYSKRNIKVGSVIKAYLKETKKEKRFVIISINEKEFVVATVVIDSKINQNIFPTEELQDLLLPISVAGRPYIEYDSFVDCSQLFPREIGALEKILKNNPSACLGSVSDIDLKEIKIRAKKSRKISIADKKKFGLFN
jgi:hypothetical protein